MSTCGDIAEAASGHGFGLMLANPCQKERGSPSSPSNRALEPKRAIQCHKDVEAALAEAQPGSESRVLRGGPCIREACIDTSAVLPWKAGSA